MQVIKTGVVGPPSFDFVGLTFAVHNGKKFLPVYVTENMVGLKTGSSRPPDVLRSRGRQEVKVR